MTSPGDTTFRDEADLMDTKKYFRLMLGAKSVHAAECLTANFVGVDFGIEQDLTNELPDNWRDFNEKFRSIYLSRLYSLSNWWSVWIFCNLVVNIFLQKIKK